jgi:hypothetical protein
VKCVGVRCAQNRIDLREHAAFTNRVLLAGGPGGGRNGRYRTPMNRRGLTLRTIPSE